MFIIEFLWDWVVPFLFILTVLVFVHELGHYLVARLAGVRVEVFSIGFGPEIRGWSDSAGTRWKFGWVPLGGYVKMFGQSETVIEGEDERPMTPEEREVSFHHKPLVRRAAIVVAGPLANFIFAIVILTSLFSIVGDPMPLAGVGTVKAESAADEAGLEPGDTIISIQGEPIAWFADVYRVISASSGVDLEIVVRRGDQEIVLLATPKPLEVTDDLGRVTVIGRLGITPDPNQASYERQPVPKALWMATARTFGLIGEIFSYLGEIITGERSTEDLGGPLRIAQMSGEVAQGGLINMLSFMAALSINLGLINLFPIPLLDGGHLTYYVIEALRGRPLDERIQEYGFRFGLILLFLIMILATWNDLMQLPLFEFIRDLIT